MVRVGLGLPNRPLEPGELERIVGLHVADLVDLDHWPDRWRAFAEAGCRLHVRVDRRGDLGDAAREAGELARLVDLYPEVADWRLRNEPNLESPGLRPEQWREWLGAFGRALPSHVRRLVFAPAVSPGTPDWLDWLEATVDGARELAGLDCHAYGSSAEVRAVLAEYRRRWSGRLIVTETNFGAGRVYGLQRWADELPDVLRACGEYGVEACCEFVWFWQTPDLALPTPVDVRDSPMETAIRQAAAAASVEDASPVEEDRGVVNEVQIGGVPAYDVRDRFPEIGGRRYDRRDPATIKRLVVHHSVTRAPESAADALAVLDAIQAYHTTDPGHLWPAIGYGLALDAAGRLWWLNGWEVVSYHAGAANADSVGLVLLGDYSSQPPPAHLQRQIETVHQGLETALGHGLTVVGHRDVDPSTECPGRWWLTRGQSAPAVSPVEDALNGIAAYHAAAREHLAAAQAALDEQWARVAALKRALGIE